MGEAPGLRGSWRWRVEAWPSGSTHCRVGHQSWRCSHWGCGSVARLRRGGQGSVTNAPCWVDSSVHTSRPDHHEPRTTGPCRSAAHTGTSSRFLGTRPGWCGRGGSRTAASRGPVLHADMHINTARGGEPLTAYLARVRLAHHLSRQPCQPSRLSLRRDHAAPPKSNPCWISCFTASGESHNRSRRPLSERTEYPAPPPALPSMTSQPWPRRSSCSWS